MTKTILLYEDNRLRKQATIENSRVIFEMVGLNKDGSIMPLQYVSVNLKDFERIYQEIKGDL